MAKGPEGVIEVSIKKMGEGTWTGNLMQIAKARAVAKEDDSDLQILIDGPFGRAINYFERSTVILVAGGIGVTPMVSILSEIAARKKSPELYGSIGAIQQVHFIWVVTSRDIVRAFDQMLLDAQIEGISISIYVTRGAAEGTDKDADLLTNAVEESKMIVKQGRPDIGSIFLSIASEVSNDVVGSVFSKPLLYHFILCNII